MPKPALFPASRALLLGCAWLMCAVAGAREKSDVVTLKNGDRLHGEIAKLEYGKLSLKTDYMGTLSIEWPAVTAIESKFHFDVEMNNGVRRFGSIYRDWDENRGSRG